jgi:hypothetical protein
MKSSFRVVVLLGVAAVALAPAAGLAQVVYRDPVTGRIVEPPPGVTVPVPRQTAPAPPVETPGTTAGGGVKLDLRGQPREAFVATRDGTGPARVECVPQVQP